MTFSDLQIIIPVYNEADNILNTLNQIREKVHTPHRIMVIYDFDEDNTLPIIERYIEELNRDNIQLIKNKHRPGVLNAIKTGFESCKDGVTLVVMADTSDDMSIVDAMFEKINGGYDIVCGSRYMKGGKQIGGPVLKKLMTWMAGVSLHLLTRIPTHDVSNSFKMYRTSLLRDIKSESSGGFEIGMEILVKAFAGGYKIAEIPSVWRNRAAGKSRFQMRKWLPNYVHWYIYAVRGKYNKLFKGQANEGKD